MYKHTFMCFSYVLTVHTDTIVWNKMTVFLLRCDYLQVYSWTLVSVQCHVWQRHTGARCEMPNSSRVYSDWSWTAWGGMWRCEATNRTSLSPGILWQWPCPLYTRIFTCWRWQCDLWLGIHWFYSLFSHMSWRYLYLFIHSLILSCKNLALFDIVGSSVSVTLN